jgi:hypothetical protein
LRDKGLQQTAATRRRVSSRHSCARQHTHTVSATAAAIIMA